MAAIAELTVPVPTQYSAGGFHTARSNAYSFIVQPRAIRTCKNYFYGKPHATGNLDDLYLGLNHIRGQSGMQYKKHPPVNYDCVVRDLDGSLTQIGKGRPGPQQCALFAGGMHALAPHGLRLSPAGTEPRQDAYFRRRSRPAPARLQPGSGRPR